MKILKKIISVFLLYIVTIHFSIPNIYAAEIVIPTKEPPETIASAALIMDAATGIVIYNKNMNEKNYPASITKIMTALLTLEYVEENAFRDSLSERIVFSRDAVFSLPWNSSNIAMNEGETLSVEEALYALMLASANEVANALAEHISGSTEAFAQKMTEKAKSLGAVNTRFANPHGLHDENHYTTAYDMALIMRAAIQNPEFLKIISTPYYVIPFTEKNPAPKPLHNNHKMIQTTSPNYYEAVIGGKTGFTSEAGNTLVTYGQEDGKELICVVMKDNNPGQYTDTKSLLTHGFTRFEKVDLLDSYSIQLPVIQAVHSVPAGSAALGGEETKELGLVTLKSEKSLSAFLPDVVTQDMVEQRIELPDTLEAPVQKGDTVGKIRLYYQDALLGTVNIIAQDSMEAMALPDPEETIGSGFFSKDMLISMGKTIAMAIGGLVVGFVLLVIIVRTFYQLNRKRKRKKKRMKKNRSEGELMRVYRYRNH